MPLEIPLDAEAGAAAAAPALVPSVDEFDDEFENGTFHERLAETYREHSPSRRRRELAQGSQPMVLGLERAAAEGGATMRLTQDDGSISPSRPRHISLTTFQEAAFQGAGRPSLAAVHLPEPDVDSRRTSTDTEGCSCDVILKCGDLKVAVSTEAPDSPPLKKAGGWPADFQNDDGGVSDTMTGPLSDGSADDLKKEGYKVCGAEDDAPPKREGGKDAPTLKGFTGAASGERNDNRTSWQGKSSEAPDKQAAVGTTDAKARKLAWKAGVVTVMVRQIPWHWTQLMFVRAVLQRGFKGLFDFIYLPVDIKKGTNVGYGFINFIDPVHAIAFRKAFNHTFLEARSRPQKEPLCVHPASVQGYEANRQHFSKTKTGHKTNPQFSPLYFPGCPAGGGEGSVADGAEKHSGGAAPPPRGMER
jgi:hypothetical protein